MVDKCVQLQYTTHELKQTERTMAYILTVILFNGTVTYQEFDTAHQCNQALYSEVDRLFVKNIKEIECAEAD